MKEGMLTLETPAVAVHLDDEVLDLEGAASFLKVSPAWLHASDVPRASLARSEGRKGPVRYLKSQLLAYVRTRTTAALETAEHAA